MPWVLVKALRVAELAVMAVAGPASMVGTPAKVKLANLGVLGESPLAMAIAVISIGGFGPRTRGLALEEISH